MTKLDAIKMFDGSARKLADALGITEQAVHQWGDEVPMLRFYQIRDLVGSGKFLDCIIEDNKSSGEGE